MDKIKSLEQTVDLMLSNDYKERFLAEYMQNKIRLAKLYFILVHYNEPERLGFKPNTPIYLLRKQYEIMLELERLLEARAQIENIDLRKEA